MDFKFIPHTSINSAEFIEKNVKNKSIIELKTVLESMSIFWDLGKPK